MRSAPSAALAALGTLLVFLLAGAPPAHAQSGKVTGVVVDASTGDPLPGAQVYIEGTGRGTLTQENGRYFLINVPPGEYTVAAEIIGYATHRVENVVVAIDVTREVNFELQPQAVAVAGVTVETERAPIVQLDRPGSGESLTGEYMEALPVSNVTDVLELQAGFLQVPQNTEVISFAQERRGVTPLRIRGGRGAETLMLIDGIPVNNFVLGGPAVDLSPEGVEQIDFKRGFMEPQYGNALSGIIDIATKEGGTDYRGAVDFRTSSFGDWVGNGLDEARSWNLLEGFLSGPVPGTRQKLRFMVSGQQDYGPMRTLEFDDDVFDPTNPPTEPNGPFPLDLRPGWQSFGFDVTRNAIGKLSYHVTPAAKLSASVLTYRRQSQSFDNDWQFAGFDPLDVVNTPEDSAFYGPEFTYWRNFQHIVQGSVNQDRDLYVLRWDHTLGRTAYQVVAGRFDQVRTTCNWGQGICLGNEFEDPNFNGGFVDPGAEFTRTPTAGADFFFGGEDIRTWVGRADLQTQLTDHHNIRLGVFFNQHDVEYDEWECSCVNAPDRLQNKWSAEPWDFAAYLQDKIELDFVTIDLGFRFDVGKAKASFLANPLDPTNGTTALDVCSNPGTFPTVPSKAQERLSELGEGVDFLRDNCGDPEARDIAAIIASQDDFADAPTRTQFSPRIGVSFPVTESSNLFFNFGRYSQNPILKNLYWFTNAGSDIEGTPEALDLNLFEFNLPFIGNPRLAIETSNMFEIGYVTEIGEAYAFTAIAFAKDQAGLTGVRLVGQPPFPVFDPGVTYGSPNPQYLILVNADFATTRGFEFSLRRRFQDYWGFDMVYTFQKARVNASDPERQRERIDEEGEDFVLFERPSEIDQPHAIRGVFRVGVREDPPDVLGDFGGVFRNSRLTFTLFANSGLPYTPIVSGFGVGALENRGEINSARGPFNWRVDLRAQKQFRIGNLDYQVFVDVFNVTDRVNCIQVFNTTGQCTGGAEDQARRQAGSGFGSRSAPSTFFDRPDFQGLRRRIDAGVRVSF